MDMMKLCTSCGKEKVLDEFHIDRHNKVDGRKNFCKVCVSERRKTPSRREHQEELECKRCKQLKSRDEFSKSTRSVRGKCDWCKSCMAKYHAEYAKTHLEKLRNDAREWYNKSPRAWAAGALRSHRNRGHIVNITPEELYKFALDKKICPICGQTLSWGKKNGRIRANSPSLDRIKNEKEINIDNIWIICAKCNMAKGESSMEDFIKYCKTVIKRTEMEQAGAIVPVEAA